MEAFPDKSARLRGRGKAAAWLSSGLIILTPIGAELMKSDSAEAREASTAEIEVNNPLIDRTDTAMRAIFEDARNLKQNHNKNVLIHKKKLPDGTIVNEIVFTRTINRFAGDRRYDILIMFADAHSKDPANQDIPFNSRIILNAPTPNVDLKDASHMVGYMIRSFSPEDAYLLDILGPDHRLLSETTLFDQPLDPEIMAQATQNYDLFTGTAKEIHAAVAAETHRA